jgi:dihydrofolate reductase
MAEIEVFMSLSLDGVMQAPGRPDEDTRGGFTRGGWATPYADPMMWEGMGGPSSLLLGRQTYEDFYSVWPKRTDNPFTPMLNASQKYVASRTLEEPLPWENSTLLQGDVPAAVAGLKQKSEHDIMILGSGELVRSLLPAGVIDRFVLLIHPLVLGTGQRLFADGGPPADLQLEGSTMTGTGVVIATFGLLGRSRVHATRAEARLT